MGLNRTTYVRNFLRNTVLATVITVLLPLGLSISNANATTTSTPVTRGTQITLQDIGVLQVAAHDLYNVNRITGVDSEDEILNLSTLFNYGQQNIANGGEVRNSENPVTHTVAVNLGKFYQTQIDKGFSIDQAKKMTVAKFMGQLNIAYSHAFNQPFPKPEPKQPEVNHFDGDLALRTLHAFIPGTIKLDDGRTVGILDQSIASKILSKSELVQLSRPLTDTFDPSMRNITVFSTACNCMVTIDLFERDSSFATQFHTTYTFEQLMAQLADGKYDKTDFAYQEIADDMAEDQMS
jgi:hypothetical protein